MPELSLENPWIFGAITVVLWVLIWGLVERLVFDGSFVLGALDGLPIGVAFAVVYLVAKRVRASATA